jgi:hypothetical protein
MVYREDQDWIVRLLEVEILRDIEASQKSKQNEI